VKKEKGNKTGGGGEEGEERVERARGEIKVRQSLMTML
jgi:hypothetical protein